jgi:Rrf2 family cysteine metabolism transcriptional repressor
MRITTRSRYGVRAMMELALREGAGRVQAQEIAAAQDISPGYLEHLLAALRKASLVRSVRGQHGGYELARAADQINLRQIVEALEGPIAPIECVDDSDWCDRADQCATRDVWCKVAAAVSDTLEDMSLGALCRRQRDLWEASPLMFRI